MRRCLEYFLVFACSAAILTVIALLLLSWAPLYNSAQNPINIHFKYGIGARNELNTFNGTFTKDLILDGTATTRLILSQEELKRINLFLEATGFFGLPGTFPARNGSFVTPQSDYFLRVQKGTTVKAVVWNTNSEIDSETQANLWRIVTYFTSLITETPEYKAMPPARGAYL